MDFVKLHVQHENMKALCATSSKHAHGHKQQAMLNIVHLGRHQWHLVFGWSAGPWNENPGRSFFLCINERARGGRSFYQLQLILNLDLCWMAGIKIAYACAKSHNGVHNHLDFKVVFHSGNLPFIGIGSADKNKILVVDGGTIGQLGWSCSPNLVLWNLLLENCSTKKIMKFWTGSMPLQQLHPCFQMVWMLQVVQVMGQAFLQQTEAESSQVLGLVGNLQDGLVLSFKAPTIGQKTPWLQMGSHMEHPRMAVVKHCVLLCKMSLVKHWMLLTCLHWMHKQEAACILFLLDLEAGSCWSISFTWQLLASLVLLDAQQNGNSCPLGGFFDALDPNGLQPFGQHNGSFPWIGGLQLGPIFLSQIFVDLAAMLPLAFTIKVSNSWVMASFMAVGSLDAWRWSSNMTASGLVSPFILESL